MKTFHCDACKRKIGDRDGIGVHTMMLPCHIAEPEGGQYVNREGDAVSGRLVEFDLCDRCFNGANEAAFSFITKKKCRDC